MDKDRLAAWIEEGLSQAQIGRLTGRHQSTVAYWCAKHGLVPAGRLRHRPRGSLDRAVLESLVAQDLTTRGIAETVGRSQATVRHWLRRYGLQTTDKARSHAGRYATRTFEHCALHGEVHFIVHRDGTASCSRCRASAVSEWRRRAKLLLVEEAGGACAACGYDRCVAALQFHHRDPATKRFAVGGRGLARAIDTLREEAAKCVLLCANCHAEVESGVSSVP